MSGVNKVILIGRLGQNPDVKYLPSGDAVANLSLATSETWKDKTTGEKQERTEWHRVAIFGPAAEVAKNWLGKGAQVYIEGELRTRKWQDQSGADRYTTEIVVSKFRGNMQMLDSKAASGAGAWKEYQGQGSGLEEPSRDARSAAKASQGGGGHAGSDGFDDDIPFHAMCADGF